MSAAIRHRGLIVDPALFRRNFDREPFRFAHDLAQNPLFSAQELLRLAQTMAEDPRDLYYDAGEVAVGQRWDEVAVCKLPVDELLHRIETAGAWIILRRAEKHPGFAAILDSCMQQVEQLSGVDLRRRVKLRNAIIFINSPHRISTYHIDRECNFLLQIRGSKMVSVFDRDDPDVLPESEKERFWAIDNNAAVYKPHLQDRAHVFELLPGEGVHIPVNAPHWVQNGPEVAVSLSLNFHYRDALLADVYKANYFLRRLGLRPTPPQRSGVHDAIKGTLYRSARAIGTAARGLVTKST